MNTSPSTSPSTLQTFRLYKQEMDQLRFENDTLRRKLNEAQIELQPGPDTIDQLLDLSLPHI